MKHLPIPQAGLGAARGPVLSALLALITLCGALTATAALPLPWRADWPNCKPVEKLLHRGSDVALQPTFYINGLAADTNGWTFSTFVQTNAVGAWFGPLPGAFFSHTNDVGASFYNVMVRAETPGGSVNYTAFARFRMLDSPGFTPGELPLPAKYIDFADVTVLNPPWPTNTVSGIDAATATNIAEAAVGELSDKLGVAPASGTPASYMVGAARYAESAATSVSASTAQLADSAFGIEDNLTGQGYRTAGAIFSQIDAATATNAAQSAALAGKASTNDVVLTPVYSQWTCNPPVLYGEVLSIEELADMYELRAADYPISAVAKTGGETSLTFSDRGVTAIRTVIGYTLGNQTDKVLAPTNDLARASDLAAAAQAGTNYTDSAIADADASYRRVYSLTNLNQTVQFLELDETQTSLAIELPTTGDTKDWLVYVYAATNVTLSLPSGVTWWTSDAANTNAIEAATPTALYFSQISTNIFMFGRQKLESIGGAL